MVEGREVMNRRKRRRRRQKIWTPLAKSRKRLLPPPGQIWYRFGTRPPNHHKEVGHSHVASPWRPAVARRCLDLCCFATPLMTSPNSMAGSRWPVCDAHCITSLHTIYSKGQIDNTGKQHAKTVFMSTSQPF